jgi:putative methionine-R-sulfoxide reductase with GAF domain
MKQKTNTMRLDPRRWRLTGKLTGLVSLLILVVVATLVFFAGRSAQATLTEQIGGSFEAGAGSAADLVRDHLVSSIGKMQALALIDGLKDALVDQNEGYTGTGSEILAGIQTLDNVWRTAGAFDPLIERITSADPSVNIVTFQLMDFLAAFPEHTEIFVTDRYGATVGATGRLSDYYQADEDWWQQAWNGGQGAIYISDPEFDESAGVTALLIAIPITAEANGEIIGILRSTLVLDSLFTIIVNQQVGVSGHAVLLDATGAILYDPRATDLRVAAGLPAEIDLSETGRTDYFEVAPDGRGNESIFGVARLHPEPTGQGQSLLTSDRLLEAVVELGWTVVFLQSADEAFAPVSSTLNTLSVAGVLVASLALVTIFLFSRTIVRPIQALEKSALEMSEGNLDAELPAAGSDEVGQLTVSIGRMSSQLKNTIASLEGAVADRTKALETSFEVSRRLSAIQDEQQLVTAVVNEVRQSFDYYHVHIYLADSANSELVMAGGTGEAGQTMLARQHKVKIGTGLVGRAAASNTAVLAADVGEDSGWLANPLLPDTQSEVAVPIRLGRDVLGVLDVQHDVPGQLSETDADLLLSIANQVAIGLQNARSLTVARQQGRQERVLNTISQQIQSAGTVEETLKAAISGLGDALGVPHASVELRAEDTLLRPEGLQRGGQ